MSHVEHNSSGFVDPTIDGVIKKEYDKKEKLKEEYKYIGMKRDIKEIIENNGYILEGPISLINLDSGRKRRIY